MHKGILGGIALGLAVAMQVTALAQEAPMPPLRPDQDTFLALYKELVETNTTLSAGSCTLAAERLADHPEAGGFPGAGITVFFRARPSQGGWAGGDIAGNQQDGEAHAAARPPRCR